MPLAVDFPQVPRVFHDCTLFLYCAGMPTSTVVQIIVAIAVPATTLVALCLVFLGLYYGYHYYVRHRDSESTIVTDSPETNSVHSKS